MRWQCKHCPIYTESHFSRLSTNYSKLSHLRALPAWWCCLPLLVVNRNVEINLWGASMENSLLTNRSSLPSRVAKLNLNINCWIIKLWKRKKDRQEVRAWNKIHSWHFYMSLLFFLFFIHFLGNLFHKCRARKPPTIYLQRIERMAWISFWRKPRNLLVC